MPRRWKDSLCRSTHQGCAREAKSSPERSYGFTQTNLKSRASKVARSHWPVFPDRRKDFMLAEVGEERSFPAERRHLRKDFKAEVAPLEFAFAEIAPLSEGNGTTVIREHRQRITMDKILGEDIGSGAIKLIRFNQTQVVGKDVKHVGAPLSDVVR